MRLARIQEKMAESGHDALLLTLAADIFYTTGFLTRFWESPARPWFVIVPATGEPVAVIPSIGADLMGRTWVSDIRTWHAPDPRDEGVTLLMQALADITPEQGQIGLPMGSETHVRMPMADYQHLRNRLAPRRFVDATDCIHRVREVKSAAEIDKIRAACDVAALAFARVPEFAAKGRSLADVFREFQMALLASGADWVSYVAGGAGPHGYRDVISPAGSRVLQHGDILMLDTGAVKDGYFCDFDRNFSIGPASVTARKAQDALWHATEDALAALRPGMLACEARGLLSDGLRKHGVVPARGRLGHGLGITLTEWPSFTPQDRTLLRSGMVLTLEPGCETQDGMIMVHEENIVLRDHGPELLSPRAPAHLPQIMA